jgi:hypothetical protein
MIPVHQEPGEAAPHQLLIGSELRVHSQPDNRKSVMAAVESREFGVTTAGSIRTTFEKRDMAQFRSMLTVRLRTRERNGTIDAYLTFLLRFWQDYQRKPSAAVRQTLRLTAKSARGA